MNQATESAVQPINAANPVNPPFVGFILNSAVAVNEGEQWAGILIGKDGAPDQHIILLPNEPAERLNHQDAAEWAASQGGELPTRRELSLLFANLKESFQERAYWSAETHAAYAGYAWYQYVDSGDQDGHHESSKLCVRAVRRQVI